jgi:hypothetical protein
LTSATILLMDAVMASVSTSAGIAQNTVSRMIIGGFTGFRMMIALPRPAPPTCSMACAVVSVNSSMFARVPGPAERDEIDATISAYSTGTTEDTTLTIGIVAWPPQVIMLRFGASVSVFRFTGGHTNGPVAAGVSSMAVIPAASYRGALAKWAFADVASKTMPGSVSCARSQSTPSADAGTRMSRARARPSEAGRRRPWNERDVLAAQQLDEQVGADVARPDDRGGELAHLPS